MIMRLKGRTSGRDIAAVVGAPVPPLTPLGDMPETTATVGTESLKYLLVDDNVLVVDPIKMLIVDVIHGAAIR